MSLRRKQLGADQRATGSPITMTEAIEKALLAYDPTRPQDAARAGEKLREIEAWNSGQTDGPRP